jgi:hypothetical protein
MAAFRYLRTLEIQHRVWHFWQPMCDSLRSKRCLPKPLRDREQLCHLQARNLIGQDATLELGLATLDTIADQPQPSFTAGMFSCLAFGTYVLRGQTCTQR